MNKIDSGFMGDFKLGDNINYNLGVLSLLYKNNRPENTFSLNKPIIIIITTIIEALLHDFIFKVNNYTNEGVPNIESEVIERIREKQYDRFCVFIDAVKTHKIFGDGEDDLYKNLDTLMKLRNRVHIQNEKNNFERDEEHAFSDERRILAETALEKIMKYMAANHNRGFTAVKEFDLPWPSRVES